MRPTIVNPTIQEFNGVRYYLCGRYFQHRGKRLHLAVWRFHRGEIPPGYHVHHKDNDRAHNWIGNLECITRHEHLSDRHGKQFGEQARQYLPMAQVAAAAWHGSDEGRHWHSQHYEQHIRSVMEQRVSAVCQHCGASYMVAATHANYGKFCGPNCRVRALRKRRREERRAQHQP
jgi:hypothetical protein